MDALVSYDEQVRIVRECRVAVARAQEEVERAERELWEQQTALRVAEAALREVVEEHIGFHHLVGRTKAKEATA